MSRSLRQPEDEVGGQPEPLWDRVPLPLKFFIAFALTSYIVQLYVAYHPPSLGSYPRPGSTESFVLAYLLCPVCILTPTVDPTHADIAYSIGPVNALIHGAIGTMIGYFIEAFF